MRRATAFRSLFVTAGCCLLAGSARAQDAQPAASPGLALSRFSPAPAGDRFFGVQSPFAAGDPALHLMLLGDYAHNPLVLVREAPDGDQDVGAIVEHQLFLHLNGSLALWDRVNINVDVPVALVQDGESPTADGQNFASPSDAEFGDLRIGARLRLYGEYYDAFQLGLGGYVWVPTAPADSFVGDGTARGLVQVIVGGHADRVVWTFAAGPEIRDSQTFAGVDQGTMLQFGGGLGFLLDDARHLMIGPEFNAGITFEDVQSRTTNGEILLDARYRVVPDFEIGLGAGPGLSSGIGTPDFRAVAMLAYTPEPERAKKDRDGDGIFDDVDACPDVPGVADVDPAKHGCPLPPPPSDRDKDGIVDDEDACPDLAGKPSDDPKKHGCPDTDGDGIIDPVDACPTEAGVPSDDPAKHGCPLPADRDNDGILDVDDACPDVKGVATGDPKTNGCPDTDGDGIFDPVDACPNEKGAADPDPAKHGCPKSVRVTDDEIIILQQVQFDTGRATIKAVSNALLDEVSAVLQEHPEIELLEVQGHTDDRGSDAFNKKLSDDRAAAVRKAMAERGIEPNRLASKGYGEETPIGDNSTEEGRQKNRRVQFKILKKAPKQAK